MESPPSVPSLLHTPSGHPTLGRPLDLHSGALRASVQEIGPEDLRHFPVVSLLIEGDDNLADAFG